MSKIRILRALLAGTLMTTSYCHAADGDLDPGFGNGGVAYLSLDGVEGHELRTSSVLALPQGKLLFAGSRNLRIAGNPDPSLRPMLARMNPDGSPDTGFGADPANPGILVLPSVSPTASQSIEGMQRLADGSIVVAGTARVFGPLTGFVMKLDADGAPVTGFGDAGRVMLAGAYLHAVAIDSQQRIVLAGERVTGGVSQALVARLDADGHFDSTFGSNGDGIVAFEPIAPDGYSWFSTLAITADDNVVAGGVYESDLGDDFSIARLDSVGAPDPTFADAGWRVFHLQDDASTVNGIDRLLLTPEGKIVLAAHRMDAKTGVGVVLGRLDANGADDAGFGDATTPGYQRVDLAPTAYNRYPSAIVRQDDGKLLVSVSYATPDKQDFAAFRTSADGALDTTFGAGGFVDFDLAPSGSYSDLTAMTLQDGKPVFAGAAKRDPSSFLSDLGVVRVQNGNGDDDTVFRNGFEAALAPDPVSTYDDLPESFLGTSYHYNGVTYHDANGIGGVFPDGSTFTPADVGDLFIIEDAALMYDDFPDFGSSPNTLTFGDVFVNGPNFSVGALVRATMDLDTVANAASVDLAYYENGPWGGIELHMDAYREGILVGSDSLTISNLGGRDNLTTASFSVAGADFDSLRLYATYDGQPSAPRVMIDNLTLQPATR